MTTRADHEEKLADYWTGSHASTRDIVADIKLHCGADVAESDDLLETLSDEQVAKLADALVVRRHSCGRHYIPANAYYCWFCHIG